VKNYIAAAIIIMFIYLCFEEHIVKNSVYKEIIEKLLLFTIILCCIFNLVLIRLHIGSFNVEIGLLSIILLIFLYIFFIMYKKQYIKKNNDNRILFMFICLTLINIYMLLEPMFLYIYSAESYSLYLFTYFNIELMLIIFIILRRFNYEKKTVINVISVFSLMNAILGFLQYITGRVLIDFKDSSQQITNLYLGERVSGFVIGDNGGGNLGAILFPLLIYKYKQDKNVFNFILILADVLFTIFTFTRIAYLAICVEVLVSMLLSVKNISIKQIIKSISTFIFVLGVGIYSYLKYFNEIVNIFLGQRGDTQSDRFIQFAIAIKAFFSTPVLGTGHGQYNDYIMYRIDTFDDLVIHSQLLNMLVEEGIIIFMLFSIFNICLIYMLVKKYNRKMERLFIIMLFIGNLICINFNPNQTYEINIYIYYFILFGLLFAKDEIQYEDHKEMNHC
jgi:hypothetical protein